MLEIIAMVTMLIDHIGYVFFENEVSFRIIGRIAMPIYAYLIVRGFNYTKNYNHYFKRVVVLAVISQFPYILALNNSYLNIIFSFIICLLCLRVIKINNNIFVKIFTIIVSFFVLSYFSFEYGSYVLLLVLMYYFFNGWKLILGHIIIDSIYITLGLLSELQIYSVIATLLIIYFEKNKQKYKKIKINRTFYRMFYPMHLLLIGIIVLLFK